MIRELKAWFNLTFKRDQIDATIKRLRVEGDRLDLVASHPAILEFTRALVDFYQASGGPNFCEIAVFDPATMETYTVTIKPLSGTPPAVLVAQLREQRDTLAEAARLLIDQCGPILNHNDADPGEWAEAYYELEEATRAAEASYRNEHPAPAAEAEAGK